MHKMNPNQAQKLTDTSRQWWLDAKMPREDPGEGTWWCHSLCSWCMSSITAPWKAHFECYLFCLFVCLFLLFCFLGPHPWNMEVPKLGVESELQLQATATAMPDLSCICSLHHSSWQHPILNQLREVRVRTCVSLSTSHSLPLSHSRNSLHSSLQHS